MKKKEIFSFPNRITLFLVFASFFLLILFWEKFPPEIPLFYSRPWGEEQLAKPLWLLIFPATSFSILLGNILLARFYHLEKLIFQILTLGATLFSFLSFLILLRIIAIAI